MSQNSPIEWTEKTWNPVTGCSKVSPGCAHCYAETVALRFWPSQYVYTIERGFISARDYSGERMPGRVREFTDVMCHEDRLDAPLRWRKPAIVFVNSMSDLFHDDVPADFIASVFATMRAAPQHTFQILTKRPMRMKALMSDPSFVAKVDDFTEPRRWPESNVWLGVSVENQHFADERIPLLLQTPAAVRFISAEPLLGPVNLAGYITEVEPPSPPILDWVIVGGESGYGARLFDIAWARSIVDQCKAAGVACFVKQLGANATGDVDRADVVDHAVYGPQVTRYTEPIHLRNRKGGDPAEWPEELRVRQMPQVAK